MFDIAWSEMVLIGAVALIAIGPKDLPKALRAVGAMTAKARRMANEFQDHFREAMREAELESVKQEVANLNKDLSATAQGLHSEFNSIGSQVPAAPTPVSEQASEPPKAEPAIETASPTGSDKPAESPESEKAADPVATTSLSVHADAQAVVVTETAKLAPVEKTPLAENTTAAAADPLDLGGKPARKKRSPAKGKSAVTGEKAEIAAEEIGAEPTDPLETSGPKVAAPKTPRKRSAKAQPSGDGRAA